MESAQRGDYLELQWLYNFLEQTYDVLIALQERRYGRLEEMDWEAKVIPKNRRRRSFDQVLAQEQAAALAEMYDRIDNLKEAISHTASATFRMYSHLNIQRNPAGEVNHLEPLDQWNFLRNGMFGDWYWNPEATITNYRSLPESNKLVPEDFIIRTTARHIDRPGLIRYIRSNLAVKDWSGFVELFGIPTPIITMPAGATESQKAAYEAACSAIAQGRPVALPNGATATFPDGTRGNEPFSAYLKWCDEQMVLIGTGGLLTMLSMPQGIGSGSSDVHDAAFQSIARAEAYRISEIFQRQLDKPFLARTFPGQPILAYFEIAAQESTDPGTILDHATKANTAGFQMDPAELSEMTGYKLSVRATPSALPVPSSQFPSALPAALNSELRTLNAETSNAQLRLNAQDALARAMAEDLAPVRERIEEALALEDDQAMLAALEKLQADMPDLLTKILAKPSAEKILEGTTTAAMLNGIEAATKERKS
jgi:phage gp29-like protein